MRAASGLVLVSLDGEGNTPDMPPAHDARRARVPIFASLAAGWSFLFRHFGAVVGRVWLAGLLLALITVSIPASVPAGGMGAALEGRALVLIGAYFLILMLVEANLYALALGTDRHPVLAGVMIGPGELRYLLTLVPALVVALVLVLGAEILAGQIVALLRTSGAIAQIGNPSNLSDIQWFKDMGTLERIAIFGPLAVAGVLTLWFELRYLFVPIHAIAERRLAIFDGLALTKGNTWRLLILILLFCVMIYVLDMAFHVFAQVAAPLLAPGESELSSMHGFGDVFAAGEAVFKRGPHTSIFSPHKTEIPPAVFMAWSVVLDLLATILGAGAFAHAYKAVASPPLSARGAAKPKR